jgi:hypothetical protein
MPLNQLVIPEAYGSNWETSEIFTQVDAILEKGWLPSDFGICHPYQDGAVMYAHALGSHKIRAYENYLTQKRQK